MYINIDSNKYKDMTLASLHMGLIADRFKKRQSIKDLTIKEIIGKLCRTDTFGIGI